MKTEQQGRAMEVKQPRYPTDRLKLKIGNVTREKTKRTGEPKNNNSKKQVGQVCHHNSQK